MPITNQDFMESAQKIINIATNEVDFRNSASRAYYAAYHKANTLVPTRSGPINTGVHQALINNLKDNPREKIREIGQLLSMCKGIRAHADYNLSKLFKKDRAQMVIALAQELLKKAEEISKSP